MLLNFDEKRGKVVTSFEDDGNTLRVNVRFGKFEVDFLDLGFDQEAKSSNTSTTIEFSHRERLKQCVF